MVFLLLLSMMPPPFAQATQTAYAQQNAEKQKEDHARELEVPLK